MITLDFDFNDDGSIRVGSPTAFATKPLLTVMPGRTIGSVLKDVRAIQEARRRARAAVCPSCDGYGEETPARVHRPCGICRGTGMVTL